MTVLERQLRENANFYAMKADWFRKTEWFFAGGSVVAILVVITMAYRYNLKMLLGLIPVFVYFAITDWNKGERIWHEAMMARQDALDAADRERARNQFANPDLEEDWN